MSVGVWWELLLECSEDERLDVWVFVADHGVEMRGWFCEREALHVWGFLRWPESLVREVYGNCAE